MERERRGAEAMLKARRLKGHKSALTCCIASQVSPGIVASAAEDGCICWFDLRCKDVVFTIDVAKEPVTSLCFKSGNEDIIYASSGSQISSFDIHMASTPKPLESYNYNKDEINQIAFSSKSYFLAAADDSGDVKIIDTRQQSLYKTLRAVHTSICSTVQFLSWKPWTAMTGGLDSKLATWDFSKGRAYKIVDYGMPELDNKESCNDAGKCFNPAFVHSITVPEADMLAGLHKVCAVARGDGVVDLVEVESEPTSMKSRSSSHPKKGSHLRSKDSKLQTANNLSINQNPCKRMQLDYALGGHTAAVSCVSFSLFGERGRFLVSGGNDASVKLWDWSKHFEELQTSSSRDTVMSINLTKKVNWLCTTPSDRDNLIVCDTSKVLKAYTIA